METENVRHLWSLKGGKGDPSGKEKEAALAGKRKVTQNSAIILHPRINTGGKWDQQGFGFKAVCTIFECLSTADK